MRTRTISAILAAAALVAVAVSTPVFPQSKKQTPEGDVSMELIGAVLNAGASSLQYGFVSYINGVDNIFSGSPQNETTALFTFHNDSTTVRVINNGPIRIVNRLGTTTVYMDATPDGDFSNPDSFRDGFPVMTSTFRHQVVLDTTTNTFVTTFVNTITTADNFFFDGQNLRLGKIGQKFRTTVWGRPSTSGPGQFVIAGYVAGGDITR